MVCLAEKLCMVARVYHCCPAAYRQGEQGHNADPSELRCSMNIHPDMNADVDHMWGFHLVLKKARHCSLYAPHFLTYTVDISTLFQTV